MSTAVIVCSVGRPQVLHDTVAALHRQTVSPAAIILSLSDERSVLPETLKIPNVTSVHGERGLTRQRNAGIGAAPTAAEYLLFLDDDTELAPNYLASMERLFESRADLAVASAILVIDGLRLGYPLSREEAVAAIAKHPLEQRTEPGEGVSGCNIFVRRRTAEEVQFDERLPLSGWLEDFDFSVRCRPYGMIAWTFESCVAHLGMQRASRERGFLVGYAQIANSYHLWRKGVIPSFARLLGRFWLPAFGRNFLALARRAGNRNPVWRLVFDPLGRLRGSACALWDAARHRLSPERLLDFAETPAEVASGVR
ncbi:MAG TPA: glycosyltransferase [Acidobacteriaceae bacterium]